MLQVIEGGDHDWPLSPGWDATDQALSFFASHPFPIDELGSTAFCAISRC